MILFAEDVERELRTQVIQAKEVKPGVFGTEPFLCTVILLFNANLKDNLNDNFALIICLFHHTITSLYANFA